MASPKGNRSMTAAQAVLAGMMTQSEAARHHKVSRQAVNRALERIKKREAAAKAKAVPVDFAPGDHPARHGAS